MSIEEQRDEQKNVKAFTRGLHVLAAMNELQSPTVGAICRATDLPKATVIRLLQTLVAEGYVDDTADGGGYRVAPKARELSRALVGRTDLAQITQPILDELCTRLKWPSEFLSRDGNALVIEASNREKAPIQLKLFERRSFPLIGSSVGLAFLAAMPEDARDALIDELTATHNVADTREWSAEAVRDLVAVTRNRGYALWDLTTLTPGMRALAIAVVQGGRPIGTLSLLHFADYVPDAVITGRLVPELRAAGARILTALEQQG
jgi:IclR family mhp operon transcriptional activator